MLTLKEAEYAFRSGAPVSLTAIPASVGEGFSGSLTAVRIA